MPIQSHSHRGLFLYLFLFTVLAVNGLFAQSPVISATTPSTGTAGVTTVTITGSGFGATPGMVSVGSYAAIITSWTNTQVVATVSVNAWSNDGAAVENAAGVWSNVVPFTVTRPTITSVTPTSGVAGVTQVTITGSGFGSSPGGVSLGGYWATVNSWSTTQVVVTANASAPLGATVAEVENAGGAWSNAVPFTVTKSANPTITGITPASGTAGMTPVTITGSGFGSSPGGVSIGSYWATVSSWSDTQVVVTVSVNAWSNSGALVRSAAGVWSNAVPFTVIRPTITAINPASGVPGVTPVTITGSGFGSSPGGVSLGGVWATVSSWSNTQVVATPGLNASPGAGIAALSIVGGAMSNSVGFAVVTPTTASINPATLTFAAQSLGTTSGIQAVTLSNTGSVGLAISGLAFGGPNPGDFAQTNTCGASLSAGASCTINITFSPGASGARTASLLITDSAGGSPQTISLAGTGNSLTVSLSSTSLAFGSQPVTVTGSPQAVTVTNTGSAAVSVSSIGFTGTNAADFIQNNTCSAAVPAGGNCTIVVLFTPSAGGARSAAMSISDNASGSPQTVSLAGTGVHDVMLSWVGSSTPGLTGYNIYRGLTAGGESAVPLNTAPVNGDTYCDANIQDGQKYYYVVTAVYGSTQSAPSNEASATAP